MKKLLVSSILLGLLTGCGSDDSAKPAPPTPIPPEASKYLTVDLQPEAKFEGKFYVYLGRYADPIKDWLQSDEAHHLGDHQHGVDSGVFEPVDERDALLAGVVNDPEIPIEVDAAEMHRVLSTNPDGLGAGSARPDIFVDGHYSVFDALRYLALTRSDLKLDNIVSPQQSGRDTFEFTLSWDCNGDGLFDEQDSISANEGDVYGCGVNYSNYRSGDWHFRVKFNNGEFSRARGSLSGMGYDGEAHYERMDQFWLKPRMHVRFQSFSPEMTQRRHWVQDREMARWQQGGGKVVVPLLRVIKSAGEAPLEIRDLEVTAHNMRPDIFQPGVITKMDLFLSAADAGLDLAFNYWPSLSTGAEVGSFGLFRVDGKASQVGRGWATVYGELASQADFSRYSTCDFSSAGIDVDPEHCRRDWQSRFGGNVVHLMSDVWVMNQPVEYAAAVFKDMYKTWGMTEYSGTAVAERDFSREEDGSDIMSLQVLELPQQGPLLTESHFGWGIADCTECHNDQKHPLGHGGQSWPVNSADGFDLAQPYYCATCHGGNGAPKGHGETARCFWCHAGNSDRPRHHGDASTRRLYQGEQLKANSHIYNSPTELSALPRDATGNYKEYDAVWHSVNSDWDMSREFPDPYSCMTCHPNQ